MHAGPATWGITQYTSIATIRTPAHVSRATGHDPPLQRYPAAFAGRLPVFHATGYVPPLQHCYPAAFAGHLSALCTTGHVLLLPRCHPVVFTSCPRRCYTCTSLTNGWLPSVAVTNWSIAEHVISGALVPGGNLSACLNLE